MVASGRRDTRAYRKAMSDFRVEGDAEAAELADDRAAFLRVVSLDGAPTVVLPREFEAAGVIPPDTVIAILDPDWQLPPAGVRLLVHVVQVLPHGDRSTRASHEIPLGRTARYTSSATSAALW